MIKDSKTYFFLVIILSFILFIIVAIINYSIDPLNLFNKENNLTKSKTKLFY